MEDNELPSFPDEVTDVSYGKYALLEELSEDIYDKLKKCFLLKRAAQNYYYGLILTANGFIHVDQVDDFYQESILFAQL